MAIHHHMSSRIYEMPPKRKHKIDLRIENDACLQKEWMEKIIVWISVLIHEGSAGQGALLRYSLNIGGIIHMFSSGTHCLIRRF